MPDCRTANDEMTDLHRKVSPTFVIALIAVIATILLAGLNASVAAAAAAETNAVAWAQSKLGAAGYDGLCETFVENAYGTSGRHATAYSNYQAQAAAGRVHTEGTPPAGALVFFAPAKANGFFGHVQISEGNGTYITSAARVQRVNLSWAGAPYLGWSYAPESWGGLPNGPPAEASFVTHGSEVYRIAGGAPIYVSDWGVFGGPQPTRALSDAEFNALRQTPADGTYVVGGAPGHPEHGTVYRIAGGAPIYVGSWAHVGGDPGTSVAIDLAAIHNAGAGGIWNHLRQTPADGTYIRGLPSGKVYRIGSGVPTYVPSWAPHGGPQPVVDVDQVAIDNAGQPGVWSHLKAAPVPAASPPASPGTGQTPGGATKPQVSNTAQSCRVFKATWRGHRAKVKKCVTGSWTPQEIKAGKKAARKKAARKKARATRH